MISRSRRLAGICLFSALALACMGQYYLAKRAAFMWDGILLYGLGSLLFLTAVRLMAADTRKQGQDGGSWWRLLVALARANPWRALAVGASLLVTLSIGSKAQGRLTSAQGYSLLALWGAAIALYLVAMTDWKSLRSGLMWLPCGLRAHIWEVLLVAVLLIVAAAARMTSLERIPFVLSGDEGSMGQEALAVLEGRSTNPFVTGWLSHPTLFFYALAASIRVFGNTVTGLRFIPALAGTLTVPVLYLLARELFDRRVAVIAAAYLAVYHYAIHYSRLGLNNILDPLLATSMFYLLVLGLRKPRNEYFALAGVALGLGQYSYMGSRVVPIILVGFLAWCLWREPGFWGRYRWQLLVMAGGFIVTGWPLLLFFARHPLDFMARVTQLGIIQSGWLPKASAIFHKSQLQLLWEQFLKSALAFHYYKDPTPFYAPGMPLLDVVSAVPFTFGLIYSLTRLRERRHALLAIWFWAVLLFGSMLLENPPSSQRIVLTAVPVSVFLALGIALAMDVAESAFRWQRSSIWLIGGVLVVALMAINVQFYFVTYEHMRVFGGLNTEVGHEMGLYLRSLGPDYRYYFFGAPRMFAGYPSLPYLAHGVEGEDVVQSLAGPPGFVKPDKRPVFVFLPERIGELEQVKLVYPAGLLREFRQPSGNALFMAYEPKG